MENHSNARIGFEAGDRWAGGDDLAGAVAEGDYGERRFCNVGILGGLLAWSEGRGRGADVGYLIISGVEGYHVDLEKDVIWAHGWE